MAEDWGKKGAEDFHGPDMGRSSRLMESPLGYRPNGLSSAARVVRNRQS